MSWNTADASPAPGTSSCDKDMGIIGFTSPLREICRFVIFNKWEVKIAMKNVSSR
jgi:hypothetical protein